jgi:hypothetical protein
LGTGKEKRVCYRSVKIYRGERAKNNICCSAAGENKKMREYTNLENIG